MATESWRSCAADSRVTYPPFVSYRGGNFGSRLPEYVPPPRRSLGRSRRLHTADQCLALPRKTIPHALINSP